MKEAESAAEAAGDEALRRYVAMLLKWRRFVGRFILGSLVLTLLLCLVLPGIYTATATLVAPRERSYGGVQLLAAGNLSQSIPGLPGVGSFTDRDLFVSILKSRRIRLNVLGAVREKHADADYFESLDRFGEEADALDWLKKATSVAVDKEGVVSVSVEANDRKLAAILANAYTDQLQIVLDEFSGGDASAHVRFLAERLTETRRELDTAEDHLRDFKEQHKLVAFDEQARGSASAAQLLRNEIGDLTSRLEVYREEFPSSNPELRAMERLLVERKRQLAELQFGGGLELPEPRRTISGNVPDRIEELHVAASELPELGLEHQRLSREVLLKGKVYALLVQELEQARISEKRGAPEIRRLDPAVEPRHKSRPRTLVNLLIMGMLSTSVAVGVVIFLEYLRALGIRLPRGLGEPQGSSAEPTSDDSAAKEESASSSAARISRIDSLAGTLGRDPC